MLLKIVNAQIEIRTADLLGNTSRIINSIEQAIKQDADIILFPETAITGYCCGDLFDKAHFIKKQLEQLEYIVQTSRKASNLTIVLGFVSYLGDSKMNFPVIQNSVAVIQNGKIIGQYSKQLLANGHHHEDKKYFKPGSHTHIFEINTRYGKLKIGTPICEDMWEGDHTRDIVNEMCRLGAEVILIPNQSYFYINKQQKRLELISKHAVNNNIPIVMCNAVGIGDIVKNFIIFDGGSCSVNKRGELLQFPYNYKESIQEVFIDTEYNSSVRTSHWIGTNKEEQIFNALVYSMREIFKLCNLKKAQVHISGGIDSAVVACLTVAAFGKENCLFVTNPTDYNQEDTKSNAQNLCDKLGVPLYWYPTQRIVDSAYEQFETAFNKTPELKSVSAMQAIGRTMQGIAISNTFYTGIIGCGNHTENVLGWFTYNDIGSTGVFQPLGDLTKLEVYNLAEYINSTFAFKDVIPVELYNGLSKPSAELADADEDPIDYIVQAGICAELIRNRKTTKELLVDFLNNTLTEEYFKGPTTDVYYVYGRYTLAEFKSQIEMAFKLQKQSVWKVAQAAPNIILSDRSRGFSAREPILNFYEG